MSLKEAIRSRALELGFDLCAFTSAVPPASVPRFQEWIQGGHHGTMSYLERNAAKRMDPQLVLPGAQSCVVVAASYHRNPSTEIPCQSGCLDSEDTSLKPRGRLARYAQGHDYHEILGRRLEDLARWMDASTGMSTRSLWYVDTGPILERDLAQRAGIGFVGKHTNLISRSLGNWFLLGEILTCAVLEPDVSEKNRCGSCSRCLTACPTQAIIAPFRLDARRCISYLTIELKGSIPLEFREAIGDRIFGCDDCLAACPWNRFAREGRMLREQVGDPSGREDLLELLALDEPGFRRRFQNTPLLRSKRRGLLRNVCVALGNVGGAAAVPALQRAALDAEPLVAEHAQWALAQIEKRAPGRAQCGL